MTGNTITVDDIENALRRVLAEAPPVQRWLTTQQAAEYIGSTPATLESWRKEGKGPRYSGRHRFVRYDVDDLDAFVRGESGR